MSKYPYYLFKQDKHEDFIRREDGTKIKVKDICNEFGLSDYYLSSIFHGKRTSRTLATKMADYKNKPIEYYFTRVEPNGKSDWR